MVQATALPTCIAVRRNKCKKFRYFSARLVGYLLLSVYSSVIQMMQQHVKSPIFLKRSRVQLCSIHAIYGRNLSTEHANRFLCTFMIHIFIEGRIIQRLINTLSRSNWRRIMGWTIASHILYDLDPYLFHPETWRKSRGRNKS